MPVSIWITATRRKLLSWGTGFRDSSLKMHSLHAPLFSDDVWGRSGPHAVIDITEPSKAKRLAAVDETKRAIEVAEEVPFRYLIMHLGTEEQEMDENRWDAGFSSLEELKVFAGQRGVEVLAREHAQRAVARRAAERISGADPFESELLL